MLTHYIDSVVIMVNPTCYRCYYEYASMQALEFILMQLCAKKEGRKRKLSELH